jgi:hypothetical protein
MIIKRVAVREVLAKKRNRQYAPVEVETIADETPN